VNPASWIWRPSFERQRDFNPPEQRAAQRALPVCRRPESNRVGSDQYVRFANPSPSSNCRIFPRSSSCSRKKVAGFREDWFVLHGAVATQLTLAWLICTGAHQIHEALAQVALELGALHAPIVPISVKDPLAASMLYIEMLFEPKFVP